jgi:hypothetical protein
MINREEGGRKRSIFILGTIPEFVWGTEGNYENLSQNSRSLG